MWGQSAVPMREWGQRRAAAGQHLPPAAPSSPGPFLGAKGHPEARPRCCLGCDLTHCPPGIRERLQGCNQLTPCLLNPRRGDIRVHSSASPPNRVSGQPGPHALLDTLSRRPYPGQRAQTPPPLPRTPGTRADEPRGETLVHVVEACDLEHLAAMPPQLQPHGRHVGELARKDLGDVVAVAVPLAENREGVSRPAAGAPEPLLRSGAPPCPRTRRPRAQRTGVT